MVDHLHLPANLAYELPEIPYLIRRVPKFAYDRKGFWTYPQRQGLDKELLLQGDRQGRTSAELNEFFQSWLFFGLLYEFFRILGEEVDFDDFVIRKSDGGRVITSLPLRQRLTVVQDRFEHCNYSLATFIQSLFGYGWHGVRRNLIFLVRNASEIVRRLLCSRTPISVERAKSWRLSREACLAVTMVGSSLSRAASMIDAEKTEAILHEEYNFIAPSFGAQCSYWVRYYDRALRSINERDWGPANFVVDKLEEASWCKMEIKIISRLSDHGMLFISQLLPPGARSNIDHSPCSEHRCVVNQIDEDSYQPKHHFSCPGCPTTGWSTKKVANEVLRGRVPLVIVSRSDFCSDDRSDDGNFFLDGGTRRPYIAISHVWAQGLGNNRANALPRCQIQNIAKLVGDLFPADSPDVCFWIDTLCLPAKHRQGARRMAISRMKEIYKAAWRVLVLDEELQRVPCPVAFSGRNITDSDCSGYLELNARVYMSPWFRRLWTLSEAVFADNLFVQFADFACHFNDRDEYARQESAPEWAYQDREPSIATFFAMPDIRSGDVVQKLAQFLAMIPFRSTSRAADEAVCLAGMLDLDVNPILSCGDDQSQRMLHVFMQLPQIHTRLLFMPGPQLEFDGYHWAPASLLDTPTRRAIDYFGGEITNKVRGEQEGLYVNAGGWIFNISGKSVTQTFYITDFWRLAFQDGVLIQIIRALTQSPIALRLLSQLGITTNLADFTSRVHYVGTRNLNDVDFQGDAIAVVMEPNFGYEEGNGDVHKKGVLLTDLKLNFQRKGGKGTIELENEIIEAGETPEEVVTGRLVGLVECRPSTPDETSWAQKIYKASQQQQQQQPLVTSPFASIEHWIVW